LFESKYRENSENKGFFEILHQSQEYSSSKIQTDWIVSETQSAIVVLRRTFMEEGDRCGTIAAIRYFADGIKARRRGKDS
jgi:hypothetical protein